MRWQPGFAEPGSELAAEAAAAEARRVEAPPAVPTPAETAVVEPPPDDTVLSQG